MSRPPDDGERREYMLRVRLLLSQLDAYDEAAAREGVDRSTWIRDTLDARAAEVLKTRPKTQARGPRKS